MAERFDNSSSTGIGVKLPSPSKLTLSGMREKSSICLGNSLLAGFRKR